MLESLKEQVCEANLELTRRGVVFYTWGNVSGVDRDRGLMVIKPSGVSYEDMTVADMVVVDLETGKTVEGDFRPSSDTATHLELYRNFDGIGGCVHTHSTYAVAFAQAGMNIPAFGTTHADYFYGDIPCTRGLTSREVRTDYEKNTGKVIVETFFSIDPSAIPGCVVRNHGPFAWGENPDKAVYHAVVMEEIAKMDLLTIQLNPNAHLMQDVLDKHYYRKHGANAYYGQI